MRVSNELGAAHPRTARFALVVAVATSFLIGLVLALILIVSRNEYPSLFSNDTSVEDLVKELTPILVLCIIIDNVQPVLSGTHIPFVLFKNVVSAEFLYIYMPKETNLNH